MEKGPSRSRTRSPWGSRISSQRHSRGSDAQNSASTSRATSSSRRDSRPSTRSSCRCTRSSQSATRSAQVRTMPSASRRAVEASSMAGSSVRSGIGDGGGGPFLPFLPLAEGPWSASSAVPDFLLDGLDGTGRGGASAAKFSGFSSALSPLESRSLHMPACASKASNTPCCPPSTAAPPAPPAPGRTCTRSPGRSALSDHSPDSRSTTSSSPLAPLLFSSFRIQSSSSGRRKL
mmetsp:Transcript_17455/g.46579  ORF Transcript_17455/g.46579 Transcript_17455/m.46579 type:complete len:233 (+) Transcript_17455:707-1405(+)